MMTASVRSPTKYDADRRGDEQREQRRAQLVPQDDGEPDVV